MKMQMTGGVGSIANATYYESIDIHIHVTGAPTISFKAHAGFTAGMDAQGIGLLGQSGFFEYFACGFDHKARVFTIVT